MAIVKTAPQAAPEVYGHYDRPSLFLAGSIEQGSADKWQDRVIAHFDGVDGIYLFNPRRDSWDAGASEKSVARQANWELDAMDKAHAIFMYLQPGTISPVSLMEVAYQCGRVGSGFFINKMVVCCPEGFHRRTNVVTMCGRVGIPVVDDFVEGVDAALALMYKNASAFSPTTDVDPGDRVTYDDVQPLP